MAEKVSQARLVSSLTSKRLHVRLHYLEATLHFLCLSAALESTAGELVCTIEHDH